MNNGFDTFDDSYVEELRQHIISLLVKSEPKLSFHEIVLRSEGASPLLVKSVLHEIAPNYFNNNYNCEAFSREKSTTLNETILTDPHPADFDWRFNNVTIGKYLEYLSRFADKKIALLGVKTIFPGLVNKGIYTMIFNKSSSLLNDLKNNGYNTGLVKCDLFEKQPRFYNKFELVIADPPWYPEFYEAFICRSAEFLEMRGLLHLSVLKSLTRPHARIDRDNIITYARHVGLKLVTISNNYFTYETPGFERNTFKLHNIYCEDWRMSDLFIFQKISYVKDNTIYNFMKDPDPWLEYIWNNKKIKIRERKSYNDEIFTFEPADPESIIFTNISRRSRHRDRIDLWTSDNLAFKIFKPEAIILFLESVSGGKSIDEAMQTVNGTLKLSPREVSSLTQLIELVFKWK